jgi:hypothetical protein
MDIKEMSVNELYEQYGRLMIQDEILHAQINQIKQSIIQSIQQQSQKNIIKKIDGEIKE